MEICQTSHIPRKDHQNRYFPKTLHTQSIDSDESSEEEHKERRVQLKHENSDSEEPSKKSKVLFCQSNFRQLFTLEEERKEKEGEKGAKGEEVARVH